MLKTIFMLIIFYQFLCAQSDSIKYEIYNWTGKNAQTKIQIFETELKVPQDYKQDHWY